MVEEYYERESDIHEIRARVNRGRGEEKLMVELSMGIRWVSGGVGTYAWYVGKIITEEVFRY